MNNSNHCLTALTCVVRSDRVDCVNILLEAGASVNVPHTRDDPPIEEAARRGNAKCVKMLIEAGAGVNRKSRLHTTALMIAAQEGYYDCVELLIKSGTKVNVHNNEYMSPIDSCSMDGPRRLCWIFYLKQEPM